MIFYRGPNDNGPRRMRVVRARWLSVAALALYPAGALLHLFDPSAALDGWDWGGYALILAALLAFAGLVGTGVQRIAADETARLDDVERDMRRKAYSQAYHGVAAILLIGVFYMEFAHDVQGRLGLWAPASGDEWNAVMWGALLLVFVLPTACLAWSMPAREIEED